jgi:hypothetical protein
LLVPNKTSSSHHPLPKLTGQEEVVLALVLVLVLDLFLPLH